MRKLNIFEIFTLMLKGKNLNKGGQNKNKKIE